MPKFEEEKTKKKFEELREKEAEDLAKILAQKYGLPYLDLSRMTIDLDSLKIISEAEAREGQMAVFQSVGKKLQVAVKNPESPKTKGVLEELRQKRFEPELFLVSESRPSIVISEGSTLLLIMRLKMFRDFSFALSLKLFSPSPSPSPSFRVSRSKDPPSKMSISTIRSLILRSK